MKKKISPGTIDKSISIVLSFVLFIILTCITILMGIYTGLFHKSVLINNIYVSDYGEEVLEYVSSRCEDITLSSGVPSSSLNNVFSETIIHHDINKYAKATLNGEEYEFETTEIEKKIRENINIYLEEQQIVLDEEQNVHLNEFIKAVCDEYENAVKIPFLDKFYFFKEKFDKIFMIAMLICVPLLLICGFIIYKTNRWRHRTVRYIIYSATSTAFITIMVPSIFLIAGKYKNISLSPEHFYRLIVSTIEEFLKNYIYLGVLWIIITAFLFVVVNRLKNCSFNKRPSVNND